jgi:hypothetical protein
VPHKVVEFQDTPNPNALKCIVDPPIPEREGSEGDSGLRSYLSASAAANDPLAARLFTLPGVAGVFISQGWLTITKAPAAEWKSLKPALKKALADAG